MRQKFVLDWHGIHGAPHWARVRANGLLLAGSTGANTRVVEAFAFVHDSCRLHDGVDPEHGPRAAEYAEQLIDAGLIMMEPSELELLTQACRGHSEGDVEAEITVATCWDADRLDLGRVGVRPDPARLCTDAACDPVVIGWAYARSVR